MQYAGIAPRLVLGHLWLLLQQADSRVWKTLSQVPCSRQTDDATTYDQEIRARCLQRGTDDVSLALVVQPAKETVTRCVSKEV